MAGDPRTRDPAEPMPIIPDHRYDAEKPVGYDPKEGPRYIDACGCSGCPCKDSPPEDAADEEIIVELELPVEMEVVENPYLMDALASLCEERRLAERAISSARHRTSKSLSVLASFNTVHAWRTGMFKGEWPKIRNAAVDRKIPPELEARVVDLFRRRAHEIVAVYKTPLNCHTNPHACHLRSALRRGSVEDVVREAKNSGESLAEWVTAAFGPESMHYVGSEDFFRKMKVWAMPEVCTPHGK